jgi:hypothetical protein
LARKTYSGPCVCNSMNDLRSTLVTFPIELSTSLLGLHVLAPHPAQRVRNDLMSLHSSCTGVITRKGIQTMIKRLNTERQRQSLNLLVYCIVYLISAFTCHLVQLPALRSRCFLSWSWRKSATKCTATLCPLRTLAYFKANQLAMPTSTNQRSQSQMLVIMHISASQVRCSTECEHQIVLDSPTLQYLTFQTSSSEISYGFQTSQISVLPTRTINPTVVTLRPGHVFRCAAGLQSGLHAVW